MGREFDPSSDKSVKKVSGLLFGNDVKNEPDTIVQPLTLNIMAVGIFGQTFVYWFDQQELEQTALRRDTNKNNTLGESYEAELEATSASNCGIYRQCNADNYRERDHNRI